MDALAIILKARCSLILNLFLPEVESYDVGLGLVTLVWSI